MVGILERLSRWGARATMVAMLALAIVLVVSLLIGIFFRYIIGQALSWPEELSMLLFTWLVLLTSSLGVREGFHVRLSILFERLPSPIRKVLARLITMVITGFGAILIYSGNDLVVRTGGHISATIGYPLEVINYAAPVCGALIVIHGLYYLFTSDKED